MTTDEDNIHPELMDKALDEHCKPKTGPTTTTPLTHPNPPNPSPTPLTHPQPP